MLSVVHSKMTPLHEAAENGNTEVLDVLLKANAEVFYFKEHVIPYHYIICIYIYTLKY